MGRKEIKCGRCSHNGRRKTGRKAEVARGDDAGNVQSTSRRVTFLGRPSKDTTMHPIVSPISSKYPSPCPPLLPAARSPSHAFLLPGRSRQSAQDHLPLRLGPLIPPCPYAVFFFSSLSHFLSSTASAIHPTRPLAKFVHARVRSFPARRDASTHSNFLVTPLYKVKLEDVINKKHLPPLGLKDFEEWLLYVDGSPENLYVPLLSSRPFSRAHPRLQLLHAMASGVHRSLFPVGSRGQIPGQSFRLQRPYQLLILHIPRA